MNEYSLAKVQLVTEQTSISIPNHKVYKTNGALNVGGTIIITLS